MKGLHWFTPANTIYYRSGKRTCRECRETYVEQYQRRLHPALPHVSGWCEKRLHRWTEENTIVSATGKVRCKPCRRWQSQQLVQVGCVAKACKAHTSRSQPGTYICPKHRLDPPAWIFRAGLRIVGTEVVAA